MVAHESLYSARILIVDDDADTLAICATLLQMAGYTNIITALDSRQVLARFVEDDPDIVIIDIMMPYVNGFQLLELLHKSQPEGLSLPVLLTTALPTAEMRHAALLKGAVDLIGKPFHAEDFVLRVRNLLRIRLAFRDVQEQNRVLFEELVKRSDELVDYQLELDETQLEVIARLAHAGEQHDDETGKHTHRVAITSGLIAQQLGFSAGRMEVLQRAAPLHDVGKIGVPDSILRKPGRLTEEEIRFMQQHCQIGSDLLSGGRSEIVQLAECIAMSHHERWDGRGYPLGLVGETIPIEGRILAVADVFDALTHERSYKKAWSIAEANEEIGRQAGQQFDPQVVASFLQLPHSNLI
jgi:putative two-component system response regulator